MVSILVGLFVNVMTAVVSITMFEKMGRKLLVEKKEKSKNSFLMFMISELVLVVVMSCIYAMLTA